MVRKLFLLCILIFFSNVAFSQNDNDTVYLSVSKVESMPHYKNGVEGLFKFIQGSLIYPQSAKNDSIQGKVLISCKVDTLGNTINHIIEKGVRLDVDSEALRVAKLVKFEKPAELQGKPVEVEYLIPVTFKLCNIK
ncbi:MAG: energy transducer TonB [Bacteroidales bacterium]|nr:energy transducer TonB [Bacteroidales bacterium]